MSIFYEIDWKLTDLMKKSSQKLSNFISYNKPTNFMKITENQQEIYWMLKKIYDIWPKLTKIYEIWLENWKRLK